MADDGSAIELVVCGDEHAAAAVTDELIAASWPTMGLELVNSLDHPLSDAAVRLHIDCDTDGVIDVRAETPHGRRVDRGWDAVESELALFAVERLTNVVAVHAAVLVVDDHVVVVPGSSHSGKSTLCNAALDEGVDVWSDEYALVSSDGSVSGWPRALRLRSAHGGERRALPHRSPPPATRVALVADMPFVGGATHLDEGSALDGMVHVLMHCVCAATRPAEAFAAVTALMRSARFVRGVRGDAGEAIDVLRSVVRSIDSQPRAAE